MFDQYPKKRPLLPKELKEIHSTFYKPNRSGQTAAASLTQRVESWMHRKLAGDVSSRPGIKKSTLEIGAGTLNQLQHEPEVGSYDIIEPYKDLYSDSPLLCRVRNIYSDISEVPANARYDRITSVATFEHILNLPQVVARSGLLLAVNGVLRVAIPSEGTFIWALGWKLTTGLEFRIKYDLDYGLIMKHEHVNNAMEVEKVLRFFFKEVGCRVFGLSRSISLYQFYVCSNPDIEKCRDYAC